MASLFNTMGKIGFKQHLSGNNSRSVGLVLLLGAYICVFCISFRLGDPYFRDFYMFYESDRLGYAVAAIAGFAPIALLFVYATFSFGYLVGFYAYSIILGYLWLNCFSPFQYNHTAAGLSAVASAIAFLLPALFIYSPVTRPFEMSERTFWRLVGCILAFCAATAGIAIAYNFRVVPMSEIYAFRNQLQFPTIINYAIGAVTSVVLPFIFACAVMKSRHWLAICALMIMISFYPSTLSKTALLAPAWLVMLALISQFFNMRSTTVLSLFLPILAAVLLFMIFGETVRTYFNLTVLRLMMTPSSALDIYNEYFARNPITHFCQIGIVKPYVNCALEVPLSIEMNNNYALGNYNASLFATEGIASVGLWLAPVSVFVCGLVIALGNRLSAGLPPRLVLLSAGVIPLFIQNVPFSTVLLTHGLIVLFALWYIAPRKIFESNET